VAADGHFLSRWGYQPGSLKTGLVCCQNGAVAGSGDSQQPMQVGEAWLPSSLDPSADGAGMVTEGAGHVPAPPWPIERLAEGGDNFHVDGGCVHGEALQADLIGSVYITADGQIDERREVLVAPLTRRKLPCRRLGDRP
jgi:hypothetical protein